MADFSGKVSIVTGAGQGIGEEYASALAASGAAVVVADLNADQAERVANTIVANGGKAHERQSVRRAALLHGCPVATTHWPKTASTR